MTGPGAYDRTDREEARARLKASVDALAERANLQVQMQKEPLKMLGGASAVGALVGVVLGRQLRRSKKIYVDADSPVRYQKDFIKAQQKHKGGGGVGGALVATLGTLAFKTLQDRVITPKLEELAGQMLERSGQAGPSRGAGSSSATGAGPRAGARQTQPGAGRDTSTSAAPTRQPAGHTGPTSSGGTASFLKRDGGSPREVYGEQTLPSGVSEPPKPKSTVEAKAQGSTIAPQEKVNPNLP